MCILHSRDTHAGAMLATMGDPAHATANATFHVRLHLALPFVPVFVCMCGEGGGSTQMLVTNHIPIQKSPHQLWDDKLLI